MMISDKLPTAVDYTNILVNYLEVSYDDVADPAAADQPAKTGRATPVQDRPAPEGVFPPQELPPSPTPAPVKPPVPEVPDTSLPQPEKRYHQNIPKYLLDLDAPEESSRFARANAATANLPTPPSLPMFLSKSILNGTTPMKDDSSVLIMPNHTVLNHLATSSIKDNILATSATTRYKQKVRFFISTHGRANDAVPHNHHVQTKGRERGSCALRQHRQHDDVTSLRWRSNGMGSCSITGCCMGVLVARVGKHCSLCSRLCLCPVQSVVLFSCPDCCDCAAQLRPRDANLSQTHGKARSMPSG